MPQFDYIFPPGNPPLQDGDTPASSVLPADLYTPRPIGDIGPGNPTASLDVMNGFLDTTNLEPGNPFTRAHLQKGSQSGGGAAGATANMDFFKDLFTGSSLAFRGDEKSDAELRGQYTPVPGAGVTFYLPYPAHVLFMWNIGWFNDGPFGQPTWDVGDPEGRAAFTGVASYDGFNVSQLQLFFDNGLGVIQDTTNKRKCPAGYNNFTGGNDATHLASLDTARYWCGHKLVKGMPAGQHSAGLRLFAPYTTYEYDPNAPPDPNRGFGHRDGIVQQTRVRVRSMRYIWFRPSKVQL